MTDSSFCQQRLLAQLNNVPLTRFIPANPYLTNTYTKQQLDMRRKVEILKYSANKSSTQTNNLTKNERFALLVKGGLSRRQANIQTNAVNCDEADKRILTPTTSSNVPGPVTYLYEDPAVPLYNYSDYNVRTYPSYVPNNTDPWQFVANSNTLVYNNLARSSNVYYLIIKNSINQPKYNFTIVTPIGLTMAGSIPPAYVPPTGFTGEINIVFESVQLMTYYNGNLAKTITLQSSDLSMCNITLNVPTSNTTSSPLPFSATVFLGNLVFKDILLYTAPTYVYTFELNASITIDQSSLFKNVALIANMTRDVGNVVSGCTVLNVPAAFNTGGASISGE